MKTNKIRERTLEEVRNDLTAAEENLRNLKLRLVTSQLDKTSVIQQGKREIARLKTVLREHELGDSQAYCAERRSGVVIRLRCGV